MEGKRKATDDRDDHGHGDNGNRIGRLSLRRRARSFPPPFLMKTYEMVENPETNSIISWSPNNTSFIIWDQIKFTAMLLPKHFRHSNFSSFVYQLNNYGFKKISWEKFEYENPWFQAGKKHWLKNIKRRNQHFEYETDLQQTSYGSSDDLLKDGMQDQLETLMTEQHNLKVEIQKLNQQLNEMENHFNSVKERMNIAEREKQDMISQLLVQQFIQNLREKIEMSKRETIKKQKVDTSGSKECSVELVGEGDSPTKNIEKTDNVREEFVIIQQEGRTSSSPDNPGSFYEDQKATATSVHAENRAFWEKMMEDDSEHENGGEEEQSGHLTKVIVKLEDLIASNTPIDRGNIVEKPLDMNEEKESGDLKCI